MNSHLQIYFSKYTEHVNTQTSSRKKSSTGPHKRKPNIQMDSPRCSGQDGHNENKFWSEKFLRMNSDHLTQLGEYFK